MERQHVWITRYALTDGILEADGTIGDRLVYALLPGRSCPNFYSLKDVYTTREAAIARAETMRAKALKAAKRKIAKLEALTF